MRLGSFVLLLSLWLPMSSAFAQERSARDYFLDGQAAYQLGNYEAAIEAWRHAYEMDPRPALQFNLAQAYGRLGRFEEERDALRAYVDATSASGQSYDETQMQSARARLAAIEDRLRRTGVVLLGLPADARVYVDDVLVTVDPASGALALPTGPHALRVERDGYDEFDASIVVRGGEQLTIPVRLDPHPVGGVARARHRGSPRAGSWITWGGAGAALVAGTVLGVTAGNRADGAFVGTADGDAAERLALGADISFGAAAALGITGLVLYLVQDGDEAPRTTLAPSVDATSAGLVLRSSF